MRQSGELDISDIAELAKDYREPLDVATESFERRAEDSGFRTWTLTEQAKWTDWFERYLDLQLLARRAAERNELEPTDPRCRVHQIAVDKLDSSKFLVLVELCSESGNSVFMIDRARRPQSIGENFGYYLVEATMPKPDISPSDLSKLGDFSVSPLMTDSTFRLLRERFESDPNKGPLADRVAQCASGEERRFAKVNRVMKPFFDKESAEYFVETDKGWALTRLFNDSGMNLGSSSSQALNSEEVLRHFEELNAASGGIDSQEATTQTSRIGPLKRALSGVQSRWLEKKLLKSLKPRFSVGADVEPFKVKVKSFEASNSIVGGSRVRFQVLNRYGSYLACSGYGTRPVSFYDYPVSHEVTVSKVPLLMLRFMTEPQVLFDKQSLCTDFMNLVRNPSLSVIGRRLLQQCSFALPGSVHTGLECPIFEMPFMSRVGRDVSHYIIAAVSGERGMAVPLTIDRRGGWFLGEGRSLQDLAKKLQF